MDEKPNHLVRWLSIAGSAIGVCAAVFAFTLKVLSGTFVTHEMLKEERAAIMHDVGERMETAHALATQRDATVGERIDNLRKSQDESNKRLQDAIDRIYNLMLSRRQ